VRRVTAKIYGLKPSHPSHSARLMAEHKGLDFEMVWLLPGIHPLLIRTRGFRGNTVPGMKLGGRRVQGTRAIARALDEARPDPPLFPADPAERLEVEDVERWADETLQNVPRRIYRWIGVNRPAYREQLAEEEGVPAAKLVAAANAPVARNLAKRVGADDAGAKSTLGLLPSHLDKVERLLDAGTIGGDQPNAADFQIIPALRTLLCLQDLAPLIGDRPSMRWALERMPEFPGEFPPYLPPEWLDPLRA
jgi:glutathione S-transferase